MSQTKTTNTLGIPVKKLQSKKLLLNDQQGQTGPPGTCQVSRLVRRPSGPPHQMLK